MGPFARRSVDHEVEAFLRRRKLRYVMLGMGAPYVLLHRPISLLLQLRQNTYIRLTINEDDMSFGGSTYTKAPLPTVGSILVFKRTNDFIAGVCDGESAGERGSGRHNRAEEQ